MLFSDIERSTALLNRLGDRYGEALSAQRALLRAAFCDCGGQEMGTEGDSFFVVFSSAGEAVRCCVAGQLALAGYAWPDGVAVRVRMGLHSGEPVRYEDGFVGMDVHRAARIAATAHGGQVVVSEETRRLAQARLPAGVSFRDLGFHRLKDIAAAEHLYQLAAPGLEDGFPRLKSLGAPTSLPVPATSLVGRDEDVEQLRAAMLRPGVRLVTLTGAGGVGKTRLALAAAAALEEAFPHGVFFVPLAAVRDAEVMWKAIAGSLDAGADGPAADAVAGFLAGRQVLLVLDNLEQLAAAAGVVAQLLAGAPGLVVLATSRRPLHLAGEQARPVPPLQVPGESGVTVVAACGAAQLFVRQAAAVRPGFALSEGNAADVAAICRRLDGLPLAIELAAARVGLLAPRALLARLEHSLELAAGDISRPPRQQTLRDTISWSYDLLAPDLAQAFRRMGVFAGGCDLDALAAVTSTDHARQPAAYALQLAAGLLDVSLITVTESADGEPRIGMLETIRHYALERLSEAGEAEDTRGRHARYYAAFAERAPGQLRSLAGLAYLSRLEAEHDNLRAALSWSLEAGAADPASDSGRTAIGLRLVQALADFWYNHGHFTEGRRWLQRATELAADEGGAPLARVLHWLGQMLQIQGERDAALPLFERSLAMWRELGEPGEQARELNSLGCAHLFDGELDTARSLLHDSAVIARQIGNDDRLAAALGNLGATELAAGNFDRAAQLLQQSLALHHKLSNLECEALDQLWLAAISLRAGRTRQAHDLLCSSFGYIVSSGDIPQLAHTMEVAATIVAGLGDELRAARLTGAAQAIRQRLSAPITPIAAGLLEQFLAPARASIAPEAWDTELAAGRALTQQQAITLLLSLKSASGTVQ
jgi:predicted ATPase/class 3 adenylate cyclase